MDESGQPPGEGGSAASGGGNSTTPVGPADESPIYVPTDCSNAEEDAYSIIEDPAWDAYQIRKVVDITFTRYETNASGEEAVVTEDYQVVTAFPKRYLLSQVHASRDFPIEERDGYYVVDSDYELPNTPASRTT